MSHSLSCTIPQPDIKYEIEIASGILSNPLQLASFVKNISSKIVLITNQDIAELYGVELDNYLSRHGLETYLLTFAVGEQYKSRSTKELLEDQMFAKGIGRDTCLIALGGGVVLDLVGYIAATYCRGIPWVMIPTSLLAMVDACLGGKTAVNVPHGKNMLGVIYQPKKVYIDPHLLLTLPPKEYRNGIVEMIKHGLIANQVFFEFLEEQAENLLKLDPVVVETAIYQSCLIKKVVVEQDEKEVGFRRILNFGHTIGHALEKVHHYHLPHGEAVAIGILVESYLSFLLGYYTQTDLDRTKQLLHRFGLPIRLKSDCSIELVLEAMQLDKKSANGMARFVVIQNIGSIVEFEGEYCTEIEASIIKKALHWMFNDLCCD